MAGRPSLLPTLGRYAASAYGATASGAAPSALSASVSRPISRVQCRVCIPISPLPILLSVQRVAAPQAGRSIMHREKERLLSSSLVASALTLLVLLGLRLLHNHRCRAASSAAAATTALRAPPAARKLWRDTA